MWPFDYFKKKREEAEKLQQMIYEENLRKEKEKYKRNKEYIDYIIIDNNKKEIKKKTDYGLKKEEENKKNNRTCPHCHGNNIIQVYNRPKGEIKGKTNLWNWDEDKPLYNFKDGDIVTMESENGNTWVCVFHKIENNNLYYHYGTYELSSKLAQEEAIQIHTYYDIDPKDKIRYALFTEAVKLINLIKIYGVTKYIVGDIIEINGNNAIITDIICNKKTNQLNYEVTPQCSNIDADYYTEKELNNIINKNNTMNTCKDTSINNTKKVAWLNINNNKYADEIEVVLNDYEFIVKNGKTFFKKKIPVYPKTYEECCNVLFGDESYSEYTFIPAKIGSTLFKGDFIKELPITIPYETQLQNMYKLVICREAYWSLYNNWKPDFKDDSFKYALYYYADELQSNIVVTQENKFLVFPTMEMSIQFKENFGDLIEICKKLI